MVPDIVTVLDELPLTVNGKLDRRALPAPRIDALGDDYREPATESERAVARILAQILDVEKVGADDSFFDLGGNSLIATRVIARINETLGSSLAIRELFEDPTVAGLAARATPGRATGYFPIWWPGHGPIGSRCRSRSNVCGCSTSSIRDRRPTTFRSPSDCAATSTPRRWLPP